MSVRVPSLARTRRHAVSLRGLRSWDRETHSAGQSCGPKFRVRLSTVTVAYSATRSSEIARPHASNVMARKLR
jgi:hypothetical protein